MFCLSVYSYWQLLRKVIFLLINVNELWHYTTKCGCKILLLQLFVLLLAQGALCLVYSVVTSFLAMSYCCYSRIVKFPFQYNSASV